MVPKIPSQIENFHDSLSEGKIRKPCEFFLKKNSMRKASVANAYLSHAEVAGLSDALLCSSIPKLKNLPAAQVVPQIMAAIRSRKCVPRLSLNDI